MAVVQQQQGAYASTADVEALLLEGHKFQVREFGERVFVQRNIYSRTNFYIEQSRNYVGDRKLTKYLYLAFLQWVFLILFLISFAAPANPIFAFVMGAIGILFLLIFTQHMYVNIKTMPYVLKQPSVPNHLMNSANTFIEITMEKYGAVFAASQRAGIGYIVAGKGTVQFQVFKQQTVGIMKNCVVVSTLAFFASLVMVFYCLAWGIVGIINQE